MTDRTEPEGRAPDRGPRVALTRVGRHGADGSGRVVLLHDLQLAEAAASRHGREWSPCTVASSLPHTMEDLARTVLRRRPDAVVVAASSGTTGVRDALIGRLRAAGVDAVGEDRSSDPAVVESPLARRRGLPDRHAASPYQWGLLPAAAASIVGVRAGWVTPSGTVRRSPDELATDLELLAARATSRTPVLLVGGEALVGDDRLRLPPVPRPLRLSVRLSLDRARLVVESSTLPSDARLVVTVPVTAGVADRVRALLVAAGQIDVAVVLLEPTHGPLDVNEARAVLGVMPDAVVAPPVAVALARTGPPSTRRDPRPRWWRERASQRMVDRARLGRCLAGRSDPDEVVVDGVHELIWDRPDDPWAQRDWLGSVLRTDGVLFHLSTERSASPGAAHDAEGHARTVRLRVSPDGTGRRLEGRGLELHERRLAVGVGLGGDGPGGDGWTTAPTVLRLEQPEDLLLLRDCLADTRRGGPVPPGLLHPLTLVADACVVGAAACGGPRLFRLFVGPDGAVRTGHAGSPVGAVGDTLGDLRGGVAMRRTGPGCSCVPVDWPAGLVAEVLDDPVVARVVAATSAVKRLVSHDPGLSAGEALGRVRVHGLEVDVGAAWPAYLSVLTTGDRSAIVDVRSGRVASPSTTLAKLTTIALAAGEGGVRQVVARRGGDTATGDRAVAAVDRLLEAVGARRGVRS